MNHYQKIEKCGIFGHNGSTWAQVGMEHTQKYYNEITDLVNLFSDPSDGEFKEIEHAKFNQIIIQVIVKVLH